MNIENNNNNNKDKKAFLMLALGAIGIVYGDIGTSPLYAFRECFHGHHAFQVNSLNVLGVLSMIVWSLILIVSFKYLIVVLRADHNGEGGILALMTLLAPNNSKRKTKKKFWIIVLGLFGSALLYGDGMITPAISVLSAIEGLKVATPVFEPYIIPITIIILIGLFSIQSRGTGTIGFLFGPLTLVWFIILGILGIKSIIEYPAVFKALNPYYALNFFITHGRHGLLVLGAVFLVVTGGEALYADLGHFGAGPIRFSWFIVAFPGLVLNYFGQGALLLRYPEAAANPFFQMAPRFFLYPLVVIATLATIIASQAVISGVFSLSMQGVHLGFLPRMEIRHTSSEKEGQIYIPFINWTVLFFTILLVLGFKTSSNLAAAYGVAVSTTMVITTILLFVTMREVWKWRLVFALILSIFFLIIDGSFFISMINKIPYGGWFPILIAIIVFVTMTTWRRGRMLLWKAISKHIMPLDEFFKQYDNSSIVRSPGTAVYMTGSPEGIPPAMVYNVKHNHVLHKQVILLTVISHNVPYVEKGKHLEVKHIKNGFYRVWVHLGFMETPDIKRIIRDIAKGDYGIEIEDPSKITYVLGRETVLATRKPGMSLWRENYFAFLSRNAQQATRFFNIPPNQVIEIGAQIEI